MLNVNITWEQTIKHHIKYLQEWCIIYIIVLVPLTNAHVHNAMHLMDRMP